ncbi:MAG: four helix bundle protein [Deltaproteobacteria bacterium]|nr:four helix bundle protein [Deltaproteobacteria bacterium]
MSFRNLEVYQLSLRFLALAVRRGATIPTGCSDLRDQLRRASISTPVNIAEGSGKMKEPDQQRHYAIARGSAMECAALLDACRVVGHPDRGMIFFLVFLDQVQVQEAAWRCRKPCEIPCCFLERDRTICTRWKSWSSSFPVTNQLLARCRPRSSLAGIHDELPAAVHPGHGGWSARCAGDHAGGGFRPHPPLAWHGEVRYEAGPNSRHSRAWAPEGRRFWSGALARGVLQRRLPPDDRWCWSCRPARSGG